MVAPFDDSSPREQEEFNQRTQSPITGIELNKQDKPPEQTILTTITELEKKVEEAVQSAATGLAEQVQTTVEKKVEELTQRVEVVEGEVGTQTETITPTGTPLPNRRSNGHNSLINFVKTQFWVILALLFAVIIAQSVYIVFDSIKDAKDIQATGQPAIEMPPVFDQFKPDNQKLTADPNTYQQIIGKQADTLEEKSISDNQIREAVKKVILRSDAISAVIQSNIESLKGEGLPDAKAVPKAFLNDNVAAAVTAELPEEIKRFPQALELAKLELEKISAYADQELNK